MGGTPHCDTMFSSKFAHHLKSEGVYTLARQLGRRAGAAGAARAVPCLYGISSSKFIRQHVVVQLTLSPQTGLVGWKMFWYIGNILFITLSAGTLLDGQEDVGSVAIAKPSRRHRAGEVELWNVSNPARLHVWLIRPTRSLNTLNRKFQTPVL